ncbi:MAG: hypothetical protein U0636_05870 [Phycisphaerales bacterium]
MWTRIIVGSLAGTVVAFLYGFITWAVLDLWGGKIHTVPLDMDMGALVVRALPEDGMYAFPPFDKERLAKVGESSPEGQKLAEEWEARYRQGPVGYVLVRKQGVEPMGPSTFVFSIGADFLCAFLMAFFVVGTACPSWAGRWTYGMLVAMFAALVANANDFSWMHFPASYVAYDMADIFLKWTIVSAAVAAAIKPTSACPFHRAPAGAAAQ